MAAAAADPEQQQELPVSSIDRRWQSNGSAAVLQPPPVFLPPPPPKFGQLRPETAAASPRQQGFNQPFMEIPIHPAPAAAAAAVAGSSQFNLLNGQAEEGGSIEDYATSFVVFTSRTMLSDRKLLNTPSLCFGAILSPGRELDPSPPAIQRDPLRCQSCGAYPNLYSRLSPGSGQWQCVLCHKTNTSNGEYRPASQSDLHNWPELVAPVVDFMEANSWRPGFIPVADSAAAAAPVILLIDDSLEEPLLQHLQASLHSFLDSISSSTRISIMTYGKTVSIYDLSEESLAAADVLPGDVAPSEELLKTLIYGTGIYLAPLHSCRQIAHSIVSSLRPYCGGLREASRPRCLGTAVEAALDLIRGPSSQNTAKRSSHVLVCAAGPNTLGPGSLPQYENHPNYAYIEAGVVKYMERLGRKARQSDTVVDILSAGTCPVRAHTLEPLAKGSGGVILLHDDFGESFGLNLHRALSRAGGVRASLEIRCSEGVGVSSVIGPGQAAEDSNSEYSDSFSKKPAVVLRLSSVEENQGFGLTLQLTSDFLRDQAYFQFVLRYTGVFQARITRVITVRLPVTGSVQRYLQSVSAEAAAVLIAKRTVLEARSSGDVGEMRMSVDQRLRDICSKFGAKVPRSKTVVFPKELARLAEVLFHLRRGPLLGSIVGHEDERVVIRSTFLQASFDLSLRMLLPRVLLYNEGGAFEEVPAYNLAMQSETAVVMDHGTDVHIWLGYELCRDESRSAVAFAACKTLVQEIIETRFPAPRMLTFKEGSSQARYLQARLIPAHDDPPYEQEARFAQLKSLSPEQRAQLKVKFVRTDEPSLSVWMRGLKLLSH